MDYRVCLTDLEIDPLVFVAQERIPTLSNSEIMSTTNPLQMILYHFL